MYTDAGVTNAHKTVDTIANWDGLDATKPWALSATLAPTTRSTMLMVLGRQSDVPQQGLYLERTGSHWKFKWYPGMEGRKFTGDTVDVLLSYDPTGQTASSPQFKQAGSDGGMSVWMRTAGTASWTEITSWDGGSEATGGLPTPWSQIQANGYKAHFGTNDVTSPILSLSASYTGSITSIAFYNEHDVAALLAPP